MHRTIDDLGSAWGVASTRYGARLYCSVHDQPTVLPYPVKLQYVAHPVTFLISAALYGWLIFNFLSIYDHAKGLPAVKAYEQQSDQRRMSVSMHENQQWSMPDAEAYSSVHVKLLAEQSLRKYASTSIPTL